MGRPLEMDVLDSLDHEHVHSKEEIAHTNDTSDWYFPLHFRAKGDPSYYRIGMLDDDKESNISWTWRGIQHLSPTHLEPMCLSLPSFNLPLDWIRRCNPRDDIIASTHGLLLLKLETRKVSEMDALRRPLDNYHPSLTRWRHPKFLSSHEAGHGILGERWTPLMVYNPLRKEWRILPAVSPQDMGMSVWDYRFVQAHLMVDEVENSYQVILVFLQSMCIYNSREKAWTCHRFHPVLEWGSGYRGLEQVQPVAWRYQGTSVCIRGRVLLVDLSMGHNGEPQRDGRLVQECGCLNFYGYSQELVEVRRLGLHPLTYVFREDENEEQIQGRHQDRAGDGDLDEDEIQDPRLNHGLGRCSYSLEVVVCMDNLFAIIPTLLVQNWKIRDPHNNFVCMPLQFHIFNLGFNGEEGRLQVEAHGIRRRGVLRIQIPRTQGFINCKCDSCVLGSTEQQRPHRNSALWCRHEVLYHDAMKSHKSRLNTNWFRCTAKGSVIWVVVHDYVLQYDVVSGESKTDIVLDLFGRNEQFCGAVCEYTPNFYMKP